MLETVKQLLTLFRRFDLLTLFVGRGRLWSKDLEFLLGIIFIFLVRVVDFSVEDLFNEANRV